MMTDQQDAVERIEPEPSDIVGRLRYWGKSKSRMRRAYATGSHMRLFNEAADALEAQRSRLETCQQESQRLRAALFDAVALGLRRDSEELADITFNDAVGIAYPEDTSD